LVFYVFKGLGAFSPKSRLLKCQISSVVC